MSRRSGGVARSSWAQHSGCRARLGPLPGCSVNLDVSSRRTPVSRFWGSHPGYSTPGGGCSLGSVDSVLRNAFLQSGPGAAGGPSRQGYWQCTRPGNSEAFSGLRSVKARLLKGDRVNERSQRLRPVAAVATWRCSPTARVRMLAGVGAVTGRHLTEDLGFKEENRPRSTSRSPFYEG